MAEEEQKKQSPEESIGGQVGQAAGKQVAGKLGGATAGGAASGGAGTSAGAAGGTAAGTAGGVAAGAGGGAAAGAGTGAAAGSVVPGLGTAVGAIAGTAVGTALGKYLKYILAAVFAPIFIFFFIFIVVIMGIFLGFGGGTGGVTSVEAAPIAGDGTGLKEDYCVSIAVPPDGKCSLELKKIFEAAGEWAKVPAAVIAGVAKIEGRQIFGYTDQQNLSYSTPGAEDPYKNPVLGDGICNPSDAGAQGPMQFLPTTFNRYQNAVNIATGANRIPNYCNIRDAIYGAAWKLKCDSDFSLTTSQECTNGNFTKYDYDDETTRWEGPPGPDGEADAGPGEVYKAAAGYYWGDPGKASNCVVLLPPDKEPFDYCANVWAYYLANAGFGATDVPAGWPSNGIITQGPGEGDHIGASSSSVDIANLRLTPIYSTQAGKVKIYREVDSDCNLTTKLCGGNYVRIEGLKYFTFYMHMDHFSNCAVDNQFVQVGELIGYMDSTGSSTGNHVHYTIKDINDTPLTLEEYNNLVPDPAPYNNYKQSVMTFYSGVNCK